MVDSISVPSLPPTTHEQLERNGIYKVFVIVRTRIAIVWTLKVMSPETQLFPEMWSTGRAPSSEWAVSSKAGGSTWPRPHPEKPHVHHTMTLNWNPLLSGHGLGLHHHKYRKLTRIWQCVFGERERNRKFRTFKLSPVGKSWSFWLFLYGFLGLRAKRWG